MVYLLDTNVFVTAKDHYYRPQLCPGFWKWLELGNERGIVYSVAAVLEELQDHEDPLAKWAARLGKRMFLDPDRSVESAHSKVREWAHQKNQYGPEAVDEFLRIADSFLVAHAQAHGRAVVTLEKPAPRSKKRILLPDACRALGVKWLSPFDMLEDEGAKFVLASA